MQHISHEAGTIFLNTNYKKFALQRVNDILFIHKAQLPEEHSKGCKNFITLDRVIVKSICNAYIYLFINVVLIFTVEESMQ
jgi:hypothetical protein